MGTKKLIWILVFIGSTLGGFLPLLWGGDAFSVWGIIGSGVGGVLGVWLGIKWGQG